MIIYQLICFKMCINVDGFNNHFQSIGNLFCSMKKAQHLQTLSVYQSDDILCCIYCPPTLILYNTDTMMIVLDVLLLL